MKIKLLKGFGGRETGEVHYDRGDVIELDDEFALGMIANDTAEAYKQSKPKFQPLPEPAEPKQMIRPKEKSTVVKKQR